MAHWWLPTAADTVRLGAALGRACRWDERQPRLLYLSGELGAGKTTLAAAMLGVLGADETVRSPSYALLETYPLRAGLGVHVDCYRLTDPQELEQLGLRDYFGPNTLWLVEWPERAGAALPPPDLAVRLSWTDAGRTAQIEAGSSAGAAWVAQVAVALPSQN
jgi:tRNA threonylcarbamoyladenosine biosynthesis protein TsaE